MMVGTGASALGDAVELTRAAVALRFAGALVIPPFYYKGVSEDGVFAYVAALIERVGSGELRMYLYNFPANSGVPYTLPLVERLLAAYPGVIVGLKDSSNDAVYAAALQREFPQLDVFPSSESVLAASRRAGYAGCISATANVTAPFAARVWSAGDDAEADAREAEVAAIRAAILSVPSIPAIHALLAELHGDDLWSRVVPPLHALDAGERAALETRLAATVYREHAARR
jgi:4-hydroxy-tetrahydrodipicolinate synthase